jgi:hypothetical protein
MMSLLSELSTSLGGGKRTYRHCCQIIASFPAKVAENLQKIRPPHKYTVYTFQAKKQSPITLNYGLYFYKRNIYVVSPLKIAKIFFGLFSATLFVILRNIFWGARFELFGRKFGHHLATVLTDEDPRTKSETEGTSL